MQPTMFMPFPLTLFLLILYMILLFSISVQARPFSNFFLLVSFSLPSLINFVFYFQQYLYIHILDIYDPSSCFAVSLSTTQKRYYSIWVCFYFRFLFGFFFKLSIFLSINYVYVNISCVIL